MPLRIGDKSVHLIQCHVKKTVWDYWNFVTWCIILLEAAMRSWVQCGDERWWTWSATILVQGAEFKLCPVMYWGTQSVSRKYPPYHYSTSTNGTLFLIQDRMDPCFHIFYPKLWPHRQAAVFQSSIVKMILTNDPHMYAYLCVYLCCILSLFRQGTRTEKIT